MAYEVFSDSKLLKIPTKRAAWSDRTALLMATMSKLAYDKFEQVPGEDEKERYDQTQLDGMLERMLGPSGESSPAASDGEEVEDLRPEPTEKALELQKDLRKAGFVIARLFNDKETDTQAFVAISEPSVGPKEPPFGDEKIAILSFRGTQSLKNWMTNIKAIQEKVSGVEVHKGFQAAFESVEKPIKETVGPLIQNGHTLYITGHSLGGALALIATREILANSHGSCYTFGSPRVARYGFAEFIKTPIYRVVNANDLVPRIPPAYLPTILRILLTIFTFPASRLLKKLLKKVARYVHHGDMRFLRRSTPPEYKDLEVISNPTIIYRFIWYWPALFKAWKVPWKAPIGDHSIDLYCEKLAAYATIRSDHRYNG